MVILVLLVIGLAIELWHLLSELWPLVIVAAVLYVLVRFVAGRWYASTAETRNHLRHEQARRDIDRIAAETELAMHRAAARHGEVIEGAAVEVKR